MGGKCVKRAFKYRFYPTAEQAAELSRTFGCVRRVYNMALDARSRAWTLEHRRVSYVETSAMLTVWKKTEEHGFPAQVSSVPLQQSLRHLQSAYSAFFDKRARHPRAGVRPQRSSSGRAVVDEAGNVVARAVTGLIPDGERPQVNR